MAPPKSGPGYDGLVGLPQQEQMAPHEEASPLISPTTRGS
jgi:hypothetical protein